MLYNLDFYSGKVAYEGGVERLQMLLSLEGAKTHQVFEKDIVDMHITTKLTPASVAWEVYKIMGNSPKTAKLLNVGRVIGKMQYYCERVATVARGSYGLPQLHKKYGDVTEFSITIDSACKLEVTVRETKLSATKSSISLGFAYQWEGEFVAYSGYVGDIEIFAGDTLRCCRTRGKVKRLFKSLGLRLEFDQQAVRSGEAELIEGDKARAYILCDLFDDEVAEVLCSVLGMKKHAVNIELARSIF